MLRSQPFVREVRGFKCFDILGAFARGITLCGKWVCAEKPLILAVLIVFRVGAILIFPLPTARAMGGYK